MRFLRAFARFWYDFVIGDDWKIAAGVACALGLLPAALETHLLGDHGLALLGGALVVLAFSVGLLVDVRRRGK
ncbi:hypothetical protein [Actinacidiphila acididurans]|uniref:Uncharacterized protein n=1 Tax=Actinacidiphila acididurans TaxID=2784346 RepID=A0ABS2U1R2_9ACTN|nr:hypothetical protein [Actinacidiphila acididurans]MBM9508676.1 hypothetical protein [Actinacidiphila acididurans]